MKRIFKMAAVALVVMLGSSWQSTISAQPYPPDQYTDDGEVTYQEFYDELSPHGRWVDHPQHGYVWLPDAGPDFRPYSSNGHWVWTENYEWMWVSDYDWGWAPFHYGRWDYDPYYSWYWVPGYEWSPAWVAWRDGGDYYGWAPLRPGINISINFSIGSYSPPYDFWCFTPRRYILYPRVYDYCIDRRQNITIIHNTTIINNYSYNRNVFITGPRRANVEIYTGRITPVRFRESSSRGRSIFRNNEVSMYRPNVRRDDSRRFAPRNVERYDRRQGNNNRGFERDNNRPGNSNGRFERSNDRPGNGNGRFERNTNRPGNNDGRFERDNPGRRDASVGNPGNGNNLPQRGRNVDRPYERRNDQPVMRQPQERREVTGRPTREMNGRPQVQPVQPNNGRERMSRPAERQGNYPGNNQPRNFERRNDQPVRQPQQRFEPGREVTGRPSREMAPQRQQAPPQADRSSRERGGESNNGRGNGRGRNQ